MSEKYVRGFIVSSAKKLWSGGQEQTKPGPETRFDNLVHPKSTSRLATGPCGLDSLGPKKKGAYKCLLTFVAKMLCG